jgi:uncharacterized iron-regulated protein
MSRLFSLLRLIAALSLFPLAACSTAGKELIGNPEVPYPPPSAPRVGQLMHLPTGTLVTTEQLAAVAGDARIVYVGETHDNPASHRLEVQLLQALAELHPGRQALGMEMFAPSQQPVLDRWVAGELDEKSFLRESHWIDNWTMDFAYYRDLLNLARERHIPVVALNAEKGLVKEAAVAPDRVDQGRGGGLPELDLTDPYQRALVTSIFGEHVHGAMQLEGFIRAQTLRDEAMAESAVRYLESPAGKEKHLMVIAGGDHISHGFGIPRRAFRRLPVSYVTVGGHEIELAANKQDRLMDVDIPRFPMVPYDFIAYLSYEDLPENGPRLGVTMEPAAGRRGVTVKGVLPGSNAERAGLQRDDVILSLDGEPLADGLDLIYAVKKKKAGDRGNLRIERKGEAKDVEVVFQATPKDSHGKR